MGKAKALGVDFDPGAYALYASIDAKHALDVKHESWSVTWGFPAARIIADNACVSNSVQIRLQHDASYNPGNLQASERRSGALLQRGFGDCRSDGGSGGGKLG